MHALMGVVVDKRNIARTVFAPVALAKRVVITDDRRKDHHATVCSGRMHFIEEAVGVRVAEAGSLVLMRHSFKLVQHRAALVDAKAAMPLVAASPFG